MEAAQPWVKKTFASVAKFNFLSRYFYFVFFLLSTPFLKTKWNQFPLFSLLRWLKSFASRRRCTAGRNNFISFVGHTDGGKSFQRDHKRIAPTIRENSEFFRHQFQLSTSSLSWRCAAMKATTGARRKSTATSTSSTSTRKSCRQASRDCAYRPSRSVVPSNIESSSARVSLDDAFLCLFLERRGRFKA